MTFQIDAVRNEFNAVSVDTEEALQKRLARLTQDRCTNYRKKVHNLQVKYAFFSRQPRCRNWHAACMILIYADTASGWLAFAS